jgi:hypothetical protein
MVCLELVADRESKTPINKGAMDIALAAAYEAGVMIRVSGNNIILSPSLVITADHVATIVAAVGAGLAAAAKA